MPPKRPRVLTLLPFTALLSAAALAGCVLEDEQDFQEEPTEEESAVARDIDADDYGVLDETPNWESSSGSTSTLAAVGVLGRYTVDGQALKVSEIAQIHASTSRITSCGQGVLYASRTDGTLWVNLNEGFGTWEQVVGGTKGGQIACDRNHLYSLSSGGSLYHAGTKTSGQLAATNSAGTTFWSRSSLSVPTGTTEIQGGMGNIYALAFNSSTQTGTLYSSELRGAADSPAQGTAASWVQHASNLGTNLATGAGSRATYTSWSEDGVVYRKRNRAFGVNPDKTLYYNDQLPTNGPRDASQTSPRARAPRTTA